MSQPIEVEFKPCGCGVLVGEECDCAEWWAEVVESFKSPLRITWVRDDTEMEMTR